MKHRNKLINYFCIFLAMTICLLMASGCSAGKSTSPSAVEMQSTAAYDTAGMSGGYTAAAAAEAPRAEEAGAKGDSGFTNNESSALEALQNSGVGTINRKIIKTVDIMIETLEFDTLIKSLEENTAKFGGYVEGSSVSGLGINQKNDTYNLPNRNASVTVRIPTDKLSQFTALVGTLGNVTQKNENSQDITLTYADTEARQSTLKVEYERLMVLLEKAENLESVVALETRLSEVRYELDTLGSSLRKYDSLVDFSTVTISVTEVKRFTPQQPEKETIGNRIKIGVTETWLDMKEAAGDFVVWFVVDLPYIIIWAAIILLAVLLIRRSVKKGRIKAAAKPQFTPVFPPVNYPPTKSDTPDEKDKK